MRKPVIAITMGDPAGIGPEVAVAAALHPNVQAACEPVLYGVPAVWERARKLLGASLERLRIRTIADGAANYSDGQVSAAAGSAAALAVRAATEDCLAGRVDAIATAPLNKEALHAAGYLYPGHTEMIAAWCGVQSVAMILAGDRLRVIHATTHVSLAEAIALLSPDRVLHAIELLRVFTSAIGAATAPIAVAGLNPHAGEGGLFGRTETEILAPAIAQARQRGWPVTGPLPPDTVFRRAYLGEFAGVVAMYHDQGHIAMKMVEFATAVNVTMGLPIIRTSADHGTAFDIAWQGKADATSMQRAVLLAAQLAHSRCQ